MLKDTFPQRLHGHAAPEASRVWELSRFAIERLLRRTGIAITRYGPPMRIGVENAVALDIDIGEQTHRALVGNLARAA